MNELERMISSFAYSNGKDIKQVLSDLLVFIIGNFNPEPKPDKLWSYKKEQNEKFHAMMMQYLDVMQKELNRHEWYDAWGDLFMSLTPKGGARGQFFTPADICNMMAEAVIDTAKEPDKTCGSFGRRITISDPTAGSGRNLLAAHALFVRDGRRKPFLVAEDVDIDCCRMSAVNMMVHGCFGEVICHDTLTDPKGVRVGYIVNEGLYPIPGGFPTIRTKNEPGWFVSLRNK